MAEKSPGNNDLLITSEAAFTRAEIESMSRRLVQHLLAAHLSSGDHVVVISDNQATIFVSAAACFEAGFVLVCLDPSLGNEQIAAVLRTVNPAALLADQLILHNLENHRAGLPPVVLDTSSVSSKRTWLRGRKASKWQTSHAIFNTSKPDRTVAHTPQQIDDRQAAYVMFTSGSTDNPKGVVVSRGALKQHVNTLSETFNYSSESKLLCFLPAYHTDGLVHCCYVPLLKNMCVVRLGGFKVSTDFQREGLSYGATHFLAVPTILSMLHEFYSDTPDMFTLSGIKTVISTAGILDTTLWQKFEKTFNVKLLNFYGLTETISGALYCDAANHRIGSVGKPAGVEARLVSNGSVVTGCNMPGELQLRGEQLMTGYFQQDNPPAGVFQNGWFNTGDIFSIDENGYYFFKSRIKEVIKKGGITVYPQEVRRQLNKFNGVTGCEVIGLPDPVFEEVIIACLTTGHTIDESSLKQHCEVTLPKEMRPDHFIFLEHFPKTAVGKIKRSELISVIKDQLNRETLRDPEDQPVDQLQATVIGIAADTFKSDELNLSVQMGKGQINGWDSYAHLKFIKQIEKTYSIRFKARDIMQIETLEDAIDLVRQKTKPQEAA